MSIEFDRRAVRDGWVHSRQGIGVFLYQNTQLLAGLECLSGMRQSQGDNPWFRETDLGSKNQHGDQFSRADVCLVIENRVNALSSTSHCLHLLVIGYKDERAQSPLVLGPTFLASSWTPSKNPVISKKQSRPAKDRMTRS